MSDAASETPPPPGAGEIERVVETHPPQIENPAGADLMIRDVLFWRRKYLSIIVLLVATATWIALQVYELKFVTVASWVAMFLVTFLFIWGNIHRLLNKEAPDVSRMEISEKAAVEMAKGIREWMEEGIRWMFRVGAERGWLVFTATVATSGLISWVASRFDLLTLLYFGIVLSMSVPVIYVKYENKIKECGWRLRMQSQKYNDMIQEKLKRMKSRVAPGLKKQKKME
ncbi:hypothetical protein ACH5RR_011394 [Cinchona calisaya]|uniref:Reticulon-like protein n=1 Tax=Cinchona calisaya TaxID=153742 RepID=A0ABD3A5C0_9GENT